MAKAVVKVTSTTHSFSSSVNCKNAFPLNANATRRQLRKLSSKRDQNPENSRGIKGENICGERGGLRFPVELSEALRALQPPVRFHGLKATLPGRWAHFGLRPQTAACQGLRGKLYRERLDTFHKLLRGIILHGRIGHPWAAEQRPASRVVSSMEQQRFFEVMGEERDEWSS